MPASYAWVEYHSLRSAPLRPNLISNHDEHIFDHLLFRIRNNPKGIILFKLFHIIQKLLGRLIQILNRPAAVQHFTHFVNQIALITDLL